MCQDCADILRCYAVDIWQLDPTFIDGATHAHTADAHHYTNTHLHHNPASRNILCCEPFSGHEKRARNRQRYWYV